MRSTDGGNELFAADHLDATCTALADAAQPDTDEEERRRQIGERISKIDEELDSYRTIARTEPEAASTVGGEKWGPPIPIATFGTVNPAEVAFFRQGAPIVVLPNGTLVNAFYRILFDQKNLVVTFEQALFRSSDGKHWERMDIAVMASTPRRNKVPNEGQPRSFSSVRSVSD